MAMVSSQSALFILLIPTRAVPRRAIYKPIWRRANFHWRGSFCVSRLLEKGLQIIELAAGMHLDSLKLSY